MLRLTAERRSLAKVSGAPTVPGSTSREDPGVSHSRPNGAICNVAASRTTRRHWNRRPRFTLSDAAAWTFAVLLTAAGLLALCIVLTLAWTTP